MRRPNCTRISNRPFAFVFRFNGGTCAESLIDSTDALIDCEDHNGGPPTAPGQLSFIVATDVHGLGVIYHAEYVPVGSDFTLEAGSIGIASTMNIMIYSSEVFGPDNLLQSIVYHSDCSQNNLFLPKIAFQTRWLFSPDNSNKKRNRQFTNAL